MEEKTYIGEKIDFEEMPNGMWITDKRNGAMINLGTIKDCEAIIESLSRWVNLLKEEDNKK